MKILITVAALAAILICPLKADDSAGLRSERDVTLKLAGGNKTFHVAKGPYLANDILTLFPGDDVFVEFDLTDSGPKNPHVVTKDEHPERTIEFSMSQEEKMTVTVRKSGIAKPVAMDCYYFAPLPSEVKHDADMFPSRQGLGDWDSFSPDAYCIKFLNFGYQKPKN